MIFGAAVFFFLTFVAALIALGSGSGTEVGDDACYAAVMFALGFLICMTRALTRPPE